MCSGHFSHSNQRLLILMTDVTLACQILLVLLLLHPLKAQKALPFNSAGIIASKAEAAELRCSPMRNHSMALGLTPRTAAAANSAAIVSMTGAPTNYTTASSLGGGLAPSAAVAGGGLIGPLTPGGVVCATPGAAARSSVLKPLQGMVAALPEAAGLPYDEGYAYLCLLRRYLMYGPMLGLGPPGGALGATLSHTHSSASFMG
jgi:hypothetical protein